ncbi:hypothetical protein, partial [Burkholderia gladioli]|uniref:hypothetical protein n=1 Tax=Burkholderia gladioli TaxID=28095 RepID=UPI001ABAEC69
PSAGAFAGPHRARNAGKLALGLVRKTQADHRGAYFLDGEIERVSVIPGNALTDWDTESQSEWPSLAVEGEGDVAQLDLYIAKTVDSATGVFVPVPYFNLVRSGGEKRSQPILSFDILAGD